MILYFVPVLSVELFLTHYGEGGKNNARCSHIHAFGCDYVNGNTFILDCQKPEGSISSLILLYQANTLTE